MCLFLDELSSHESTKCPYLFPIFLQMRTFGDKLYNLEIDKVIGNEKMAH